MILLILTTLLALASARLVNYTSSRCDGVIVNGINHEKEVIKEDVDKPYMMSIDYDTNVLYYTYTRYQGKILVPAALNLKTKENYRITEVRGAYSTSVDPKSHKIYVVGAYGIYEYDYQKKIRINLGITNLNIWQVFAKDGVVYYTTYPGENAFVYKNGQLDKVAGIGETRAILLGLDKEDNVFFSNSLGLFFHPKDGNLTIIVGEYTVNAFTTDMNEKLYFSTPIGIFSTEVEGTGKVTIKKIAGINNIYGMAVESDGTFIYSADNAIIRLKSTGVECSEQH
ncbi:Diapause associated protein 2 [Operophtera brumata]|uniref:Diapause associated protein 2 n=1 Tax=Operophtera brumata TaxID=104452 RepID=A0A0L7L7P2_OPEBR|nr:Diapause associated protein 2 [Operophtera brumata]